MNKRSISFGVFASLCAVTFAQEPAQEETKEEQQLEEVVVSDSRFQLKRENSGKTVIKIDAKELEQYQGRSVAEIINTKSGIEINGSRSNAGLNRGIFIRGGNNRQVLVLVDGIQVSDPSNISNDFDIRLLATSQIESIEILKGAASTLYGNNAATAVINITTKKAKKKGIAASFETAFGTNQSQEDQDYNVEDISNAIGLTAKGEKLAFAAGFGNQYTNGLSAALGEESDPFSRINANGKLSYSVTKDLKIEAFGFYDKYRSDFDNGFPVEDADFSAKSEQVRFGISSEYKYKKGSVHLNAAINKIDRSFKSSFPSAFDSESIVGDLYNKYNFNDQFYTVAGVNFIKNETLFSQGKEKTETIDPYLNVVYVSDFGLNLNAGARLNNHSEYGTNLIYNVNPSYTFKMDGGYVKAFGSYATSFIAPSLSQLYGAFGPNPNLDPETNITIEGGLEFRPSEMLRFSALYFNRKEKDFIDFVTIDFTTFQGEYQNTKNDLTANGVEVEVMAKPIDGLIFSANYTFTERKNETRLRLPKHSANASLGYEFTKKTFASVNYQFTDKRFDTDFSTFAQTELEAFSLLDLYLSHQINKKFKVFASANNILNEDYLEVVATTTRGRNVRLGFSLNL